MSESIKTFDEDEAVRFIRATLPEARSNVIDDDEILYVIDCIWDWYEKNGYLEINASVTEEEEIKVDDLVSYVIRELKRAGEFAMEPADVEAIVKGELQYEETLEDF